MTDEDSRLARLLERAAVLQACSTRAEVFDESVAAAVDVLDFDWCVVATVEDDFFELRAVSEDAPTQAGDRTLRSDEGIAGITLAEGESVVVDDIQTSTESKPVRDSFRAFLSVPIDDHGVFQAAATEPGVFDRGDGRLAELLMTHVAEAIDRVEREEALRERERELQRQNERLEEFSSIVAHDLRNPLEVAKLRLKFVAEDCESDDIAEVASAHDRMETLIDDLLTYAKHGRSVEDTQRIDLGRFARRSWSTVRSEEATLEVEGDPSVRADDDRLRDLLENLFRNAVEHGSGATGVVTVRIGTLGDGEGFYVADDGPGIPPGERERVVDSGYTTGDGNTGFGLAIVDEIAEAHGWGFEVGESAADGARFEFHTG